MKLKLFVITLFFSVFVGYLFAQKSVVPNAKEVNSKTKWWQDARFGMFIHWGVYSIPGRGEWIMYQEDIPFSEYISLAHQFNPQNYNPKEWIAKAKEAGMKYIVLTTRHHDGFCLFDSKVSDYGAKNGG